MLGLLAAPPGQALRRRRGLATRLASPPDWLDGFIAHLAG